MKILLVEDNPVNAELARALLAEAGCDTVHAETGNRACEEADRDRFDLILMDCHLPDIDGFEATRRIRAAESSGGRRRVPIIAFSGSIAATERSRCYTSGMDDYAAKPLSREELRRVIGQWIADDTRGARSVPGISMERLNDLFRDSAARLIADIAHCHDAADDGGLRMAAHTLKSISGHVGATRLGGAAGALEHALVIPGSPRDALSALTHAVLAAYAALDPALRQTPAASAPSEAAPTDTTSAAAPLVLVVDDEENERYLARRMLSAAGLRVAECDSGTAALAYCARETPAAIVLDGLMPGMDGIDTARALRAQAGGARLVIVMLSGMTDPAWLARAREAGVDAQLEKSADLGELGQRLVATLAAHGVRTPEA